VREQRGYGYRTLAEEDDATLLERSASGNSDAFEILYHRHTAFVFRVALGCGISREDALDAVQETFLRLYRNSAKLRLRGKLDTWLYKVVVNLCIDRLRKRRREASLEPGSEISASPEPALIASDCMERAQRCMDVLSRTERHAFRLHFFLGRPVGEIAVILGKSPGSIRVHLFRALGKMRTALLERRK
jgi:RNA polymerase sigma-70 factor (ECF subfamily)